MTPIFVNTRPSSRLSPLPKVAQLADVVDLPLLELVGCPLSDDERAYQHRLIDGAYDVLVVVSITAVECALASLGQDELECLIAQNRLGKLHIVAVGRPTANTLERIGLSAHLPDVASNESMSQMPIFDNAKNVLFWRGVGGRVLLMNHLIEQGVAVDKVDFYDRIVPTDIVQKMSCLDRTRPIIVLITSQMAWQAWQMAVGTSIADFDYIVMGERLCQIVQKANPCSVVVVDELTDAAIYKALQPWEAV